MKQRVPAIERELDALLNDLCVRWGFCIPPVAWEELCKRSALTADEFATLVVAAEGMNPEYERKWVRRIKAKFRQRFGVEEISSETFVDRARGGAEEW